MNKTKKDYEVGYGKPPKGHQFKPGQSGNPSGKNGKKKKAVAQPLPDLIAEILSEEVPITIAGKKKTDTLASAIARALLHKLPSASLSEMMKTLQAFVHLGVFDKQLHLQLQHANDDPKEFEYTDEERRVLEEIVRRATED